MARPSRNLDHALLSSGRLLFPEFGCGGMSVRTLAEHAGVNQAMFHYHFNSKDDFLRTLLQQFYEEMFGALTLAVDHEGSAALRLRHALHTIARFVRTHRRVVARLWNDVMSGQEVAREFMLRNAPRHVGLLFSLAAEAQAQGDLAEIAPAQMFSFLMGAVLLPMIFIGGLIDATGGRLPMLQEFDAAVLSDAAIDERIDRAIGAMSRRPAARPNRSRR